MLPSKGIIALSQKKIKWELPKDPKQDQPLGVSEAMVAVQVGYGFVSLEISSTTVSCKGDKIKGVDLFYVYVIYVRFWYVTYSMYMWFMLDVDFPVGYPSLRTTVPRLQPTTITAREHNEIFALGGTTPFLSHFTPTNDFDFRKLMRLLPFTTPVGRL